MSQNNRVMSHSLSTCDNRSHGTIEVTTTIETQEHTESQVCIVGGHMSQACESP